MSVETDTCDDCGCDLRSPRELCGDCQSAFDKSLAKRDAPSNLVFRLNDKETKAADAFETKHRKKHASVIANIGSARIEYRFVRTGISNAITLHCGICGEKENVTDYDCW